MKKLDVITERGVILDGVLFSESEAETVVIAITGIHGNFYSNPFYHTIGETLNQSGIDFIYAQTADAFGEMPTYNVKTGQEELIGSWNEDFNHTDDDISAYINLAEKAGYKNIILAGHSLGANKVIYYLSRHHDERIKKFILLSPANLEHLVSVVTDGEKDMIQRYVTSGRGQERLPFHLLGWIPCVADTAYQWVFDNCLNNVHVEQEKDFSQVGQIKHQGALVIGTYDRFTYGEPTKFLETINSHMRHSKENKLVFIEKTGHTYQQREQELAASLLTLVKEWQGEEEDHALHSS